MLRDIPGLRLLVQRRRIAQLVRETPQRNHEFVLAAPGVPSAGDGTNVRPAGRELPIRQVGARRRPYDRRRF